MQGEANNSGSPETEVLVWERKETPKRDKTVAAVLMWLGLLVGLEMLRIALFVAAGFQVMGIFGFIPVRTLGIVDAIILFVAAAVVVPFFGSLLLRLYRRGWPESLRISGTSLRVRYDGSEKYELIVLLSECRELDAIPRGLIGGRGWQVRNKVSKSGPLSYPYQVLARCDTEQEAENVASSIRKLNSTGAGE